MEFNLNNFKIQIKESEFSIIITIMDRSTSETLKQILVSKQELLDEADGN